MFVRGNHRLETSMIDVILNYDQTHYLYFIYRFIFQANSKSGNSETYLVGLGFRGVQPDYLAALLTFTGSEGYERA